jgi:superfamily I DNA/RNA helicase
VFIVGLEDGIVPLYWGAPDEAAIAEERRLFYVGMTRTAAGGVRVDTNQGGTKTGRLPAISRCFPRFVRVT